MNYHVIDKKKHQRTDVAPLSSRILSSDELSSDSQFVLVELNIAIYSQLSKQLVNLHVGKKLVLKEELKSAYESERRLPASCSPP